MDHLSVGLRGRLGRAGVQVGCGAGHGHGHVGACLALLQHTSGCAEPQTCAEKTLEKPGDVILKLKSCEIS